MAKWNSLKRIYDLYTSDLSYKEIDRLIKRDAPEVYDFYVKRIKQNQRDKNSIKNFLIFLKSLFKEFLLRMSPLRRIFYTVALVLFAAGYLFTLWNWIVFAFIMINLLLAFELADKLTARDEIIVARDIQNSLMPKQPPLNCSFDIASYSEAAREVGGDYYDFIVPANNGEKLCLVIGDISGKGMGAALHMVQVQAILKCLISEFNGCRNVLTSLNNILKKIFKVDTFFTITIAEINNSSLTLCRAGHTPIIHFCNKTTSCMNVTPAGIGIGLRDNGLFEKVLEEVDLHTGPGDILVFYTDGLIESMNEQKEMFGDERLRKIIKDNSYKTATEIQEAILFALQRFRSTDYVDDDLTLVVMKAKEEPAQLPA